MKNKYLVSLGLMGMLTPLSLLAWGWLVVDVQALTALIPQPVKLFTLLGGISLSLIFGAVTVYFMVKSRRECLHCGTELERQIAQADKLSTVGKLAGGVAHEVNTPASIIAGRVEAMLMETGPAQGQARQDLAVIKKQAERITEITRSLLLFARRSPAEKKKVDLNEIASEAVFLIAAQLKKSRVEVVKHLSAESLFVLGQSNQLIQVLLNLLSNAGEAMPEGGKIELRTAPAPHAADTALLQVRDTGVGIPERDLDKIFDPFFTTKEAGTGLGLSVSYGIVQEHGGTIRVESMPGDGTTFTIYLPLYRDGSRPSLPRSFKDKNELAV